MKDSARATPRPESSGGEVAERSLIIPAVLLFLAVLAAFGSALSGELVYDDNVLIGRIERIDGLGDLWTALVSPYWGFDEPDTEQTIGYWRPLTVLFHWAVYAAGGRELGLHVGSLLVHVLATFACWRLALRITKNEVGAFFAALLFGLHPVHVESVAWVSAVNDPLYGFFALLSIGAFVAWRQEGSPGYAGWPALLLLPALLAKEHALAVVPVLIAIDLGWRAVRSDGSEEARPAIGRAYLPFFAVLALYFVARIFVFQDPLGGFLKKNTEFDLALERAASFRVELFGGFLELLALPLDLRFFRPFRPELPSSDPAFLRAVGATAAWVALTLYLAIKNLRPYLAFALLVPAALLPVLASVDSAGLFPLSDRHLYVAVLAVALCLPLLASRFLPRPLAYASLALVAAAYGAKTFARAQFWHDDETLFRQAALESPRSAYVHWGLGRILLERYQIELEKPILDEALYHYLVSLKLGVDYGEFEPKLGPEAPINERVSELITVINATPAEARRPDPTVWVSTDDRLQANLGQGYCFLGLGALPPEFDLDYPLVVFQQIAKSFAGNHRAWTGLGTVHIARREYEEALEALDEALRLHPESPEPWFNKGLALEETADDEAALAAFTRAWELRPGNAKYMLGVARCSIDLENFERAEEFLTKAKASAPEALEPVYLSGMLAAAKGDFSSALAWIDRLHAKNPDHGLGHLLKGKVYAGMSDLNGAARAFSRACERLPNNFEAHYNVGAVLLQLGQEEQVFPYALRAYQLSRDDMLRDVLHDQLSRLAGDDIDRLARLALAAKSLSEWSSMLEWIDASLALDEARAGLHKERSTALLSLNRREEAVDAMLRALEIEPEQFWWRFELTGLLLLIERREEALPHIQQCLEDLSTYAGQSEEVRESARKELEERRLRASQ